jgi:hypothetical protein
MATALVPVAKSIEANTEIINGRVAANPLEAFTNIEPELQAGMRSVRDAGAEVASAARNFSTEASGKSPNINASLAIRAHSSMPVRACACPRGTEGTDSAITAGYAAR